MNQKIVSRFDGRVLYECEADSLLEALRQAVASRANLADANLADAYLADAYLADAYLADAYLARANLAGANLADAKINWQSHELIAELLRRHAGADVEKRMVAGLVLVSRDWCWKQFLNIDHAQKAWALETLQRYIREGDNAPEIRRAKEGVQT